MLNLPRWGILLIDLFIAVMAFGMAHLLRFNFDISSIAYYFLDYAPYALLTVRLVSFILFKTYAGILFHTGLEDAQRIFWAVLSGSIFLALFNPVLYLFTDHFIVPYSIIIIDFSITVLLMVAYRALIKILYIELRNNNKTRRYVAIYGADETGIVTKKTLERDRGQNYTVNAFFDDNSDFRKKRLLGTPIYPARQLEQYLRSTQPALLVLASDVSPARKQEIVESCLKYRVKVLSVPSVDRWINGELSFRQIREIRIEDLLERDPIQLDLEKINTQLQRQCILITGAAGSIGSEIVRQVIRFQPRLVVLLDQAETPLHELELELRNGLDFLAFEVVIGDIRNTERMHNVFRTFQPDIIYHAAAYKHVPMMEHNPSEAILTNVAGTRCLADLAVEYSVKRFVMISTDKAVNPTSIMGASKRLAEMYVQSLHRKLASAAGGTLFITTRFGNVLGSNGSVIPLFKRQIAAGGPVTVTHSEMTRYFMTIPEACQLVLEAGMMGQGGEIFVFDMGRSIKIVDLAERMIRLSGFEPGRDINVVFTGLRPGEKLYEELLNQAETTLPTHNRKILIARVREHPYEKVCTYVDELIELFSIQNNERIVRLLKEVIPEYKSNNSVFEKLD